MKNKRKMSVVGLAGKGLGTLAVLASIGLSQSVVAKVTYSCDATGFEGVKAVMSPPAWSIKSMSRDRLGNSGVYPHFFAQMNDRYPIEFEELQYRDLLIEDYQFQRVNEGSREKPDWVRYYRSVNMDDCSRVYLRLEEQSPEYQHYFADRGDMPLNVVEFMRHRSGSLEFYLEKDRDALVSMVDKWVSPIPLRDSQWYVKNLEGGYEQLVSLASTRFMVKEVKLEPFVYRGSQLSSLTIGIETPGGDRYWAPGHAHALVPWEEGQVVGDVAVGDDLASVFRRYGHPDQSWRMPVFETESGRRIVEDKMLRSRLSEGGSVHIGAVQDGSRIGHFRRLVYNMSDDSQLIIVVNLDGKVERVLKN